MKRHVWLGVEAATDVFELQLSDPATGAPLADRVTAFSIAVALRQALTELLGVDEREIGCAAVKARSIEDQVTQTIVLFDAATGGAGFVASAPGELEAMIHRATELLQCRQGCDRACHRCLLTYDTHRQVDDLDRHAALTFLRGPIAKALSLPDGVRLFGDATRAELDPLAVALRKHLQRPQVNEVRVFVGGDMADWDLHAWSIRTDLVRWASEGRRVRLLAPSGTVSKISPEVAYPLGALLEGASLEMIEVDQSAPKLIAQVGGSQGYTSWALTTDHGGVPGPMWGDVADGDGLCVRAREVGSLPELSGNPIPGGDLLRAATPVGTQVTRVRSELDGKLSSLGSRLLELLAKESPHLRQKLDSGAMVTAIRYTDRYLRSPLAVGAFCSLAEALAAAAPAAMESAKVIVRTEQLPTYGRPPANVDRDWQRSDSRRSVARSLLPSFADRVDLKEARRGDLQHARVLTIDWSDGTSWTIHLDQGFGYWRPTRPQPFPFERPPASQAKALRRGDLEICASSNRFPTFLFLGPVK